MLWSWTSRFPWQHTNEAFVARGVWVRPFGKLVYVMPPYIMDSSDVDTLTTAIVERRTGQSQLRVRGPGSPVIRVWCQAVMTQSANHPARTIGSNAGKA